jgi:hypothetical protein
LECDSGGARRHFSSASGVHTGLEDQEAPELSHRASKGPMDWYGPKDATWEHEDAMRKNTRIFLNIFENFDGNM